MKSFCLLFILILLCFFPSYGKEKLNQENIAFHILKNRVINFETYDYLKSLEKNNFKHLNSDINNLINYVFTINVKDLIVVNHRFEKNIKVFALNHPSLTGDLFFMVAIDQNGLFYYLNGFETDHFNKMFINKIIKFLYNDNFAQDIIDLYSRTVMLKHDTSEELIKKSIKVIKKNKILDVEFQTKSQRNDEIYKYSIEIKEVGLFLKSRVKVK